MRTSLAYSGGGYHSKCAVVMIGGEDRAWAPGTSYVRVWV